MSQKDELPTEDGSTSDLENKWQKIAEEAETQANSEANSAPEKKLSDRVNLLEKLGKR